MIQEERQLGEIPSDWDRLDNRPDEEEILDVEPPEDAAGREPPILLLVAAAWADLVCLLAISAVALLALVLGGYRVSLAGIPWLILLAGAWWSTACAVLVTVRRGTPGMLLAGIVFDDTVTSNRLARVVAAAATTAVLIGLPAALGHRLSLLRIAADRTITTSS